jgi:hypothetical protein
MHKLRFCMARNQPITSAQKNNFFKFSRISSFIWFRTRSFTCRTSYHLPLQAAQVMWKLQACCKSHSYIYVCIGCYIYIYTHTHTYTHIHRHIHTYIQTYLHTYYIHTYTYNQRCTHTKEQMHSDMPIYTYLHESPHSYLFIRIHAHTNRCKHLHMHAYINIYTHTYICTYNTCTFCMQALSAEGYAQRVFKSFTCDCPAWCHNNAGNLAEHVVSYVCCKCASWY